MGSLRLSLIGATLLALSITAGCSVSAKGTFCAISDPIRLSPAAVAALSDAEVENILAHNKRGAALCGWKP